MARKSEIKARARAGVELLLAASQAQSEEQADRHIREAFDALASAAGIVPDGRRLSEVSADRSGSLTRLGVDREFGVELRERDFSQAQRTALAKRGQAIPVKNERGEITGGRYPIETRQDVENAVHDADRTGAGGKVRKHLVRQAKRLGASDLIPASWTDGKARESAPLTLRERAAVGEVSLAEALHPEAREDPRLSLLERLGIDSDYLGR